MRGLVTQIGDFANSFQDRLNGSKLDRAPGWIERLDNFFS